MWLLVRKPPAPATQHRHCLSSFVSPPQREGSNTDTHTMLQTYHQYDILYQSIIRIFPLLSILGSSIVIYWIVQSNPRRRRRGNNNQRRRQLAANQGDNNKNEVDNTRRQRSLQSISVSHMKPTYRRFMLTLCVVDIIFSTSFVLGPLMVPKEATIYIDANDVTDRDDLPNAQTKGRATTTTAIWKTAGGYGTSLTCVLQGMMVGGGASSLAYVNACLMIYFVLTIRYNISESYMSQKVEPIIYSLLVTSWIIGIVLGSYYPIYSPSIFALSQGMEEDVNSSFFFDLTPDTYRKYMVEGTLTNQDMGFIIPFCFVDSYPDLCDDERTQGSGVHCSDSNGLGTRYYRYGVIITGILVLIMFVSLLMIVFTARKTELATTKNQTATTKDQSRSPKQEQSVEPFHMDKSTLNRTTSSSSMGVETTKNSTITSRQSSQEQPQHATSPTTEIRLTTVRKRVTRQAILYGIFFLNTYLWTVLSVWLSTNVADILTIVFQSSQGIFNCMIFLSPYLEEKWNQWRKQQQQQRQRQRPVQEKQDDGGGCDSDNIAKHHKSRLLDGLSEEERGRVFHQHSSPVQEDDAIRRMVYAKDVLGEETKEEITSSIENSRCSSSGNHGHPLLLLQPIHTEHHGPSPTLEQAGQGATRFYDTKTGCGNPEVASNEVACGDNDDGSCWDGTGVLQDIRNNPRYHQMDDENKEQDDGSNSRSSTCCRLRQQGEENNEDVQQERQEEHEHHDGLVHLLQYEQYPLETEEIIFTNASVMEETSLQES